MDYFFRPGSVAVIGASAKPGKIGCEVLRSVLASGFRGKVYPINPKKGMIDGLKVYPRIDEVPGDIDLALVAVHASLVPDVIEQCATKEVKGVIVISGGFRELGDEGARLERDLVKAAKKSRIRVIGPNCIGVLNGENGFNTLFHPTEAMERPPMGNISIVTQSGTYGVSLLEWIAESGLGVSKFVSFGNKCDLDEVDALSYLADDPCTKVIGLYVEDVRDGKAFMNIARRLSWEKPVVAIKAGATKAGASAAKSHTGALTGRDEVFRGAAAQAGLILVDDLDEMFDVLKVISTQPLPRGRGVGMVTNGAGPCVVAVDWIERFRTLRVAKLTERTLRSLSKSLPKGCIVSNPVDLTGSAVAHDFKVALKALAQDPEVGILLPAFVFQDGMLLQTISDLQQFMPNLRSWGKTVVACASGGEYTRTQQSTMQERGVPVIETPRRAVLALTRIAEHTEWRSLRRSKTRWKTPQGVNTSRTSLGPWAQDTPTEKEVKDVLRAHGIQTPRYQLIAPGQGVEEVNLPYPLVLKVCSSTLLHKSEVGGVSLGINDPEQLQQQFRRVRKKFPREDLLVETMEKGEVEIIVGLVRDQTFGLTVMVGLGGIFAEILEDVAFRILPITRIDADGMLKQLRSARILEGYRGVRPSRQALEDLLLKVSAMGLELEELIDQLDLNPVLLGERSAVVVDAKLLPRRRPMRR